MHSCIKLFTSDCYCQWALAQMVAPTITRAWWRVRLWAQDPPGACVITIKIKVVHHLWLVPFHLSSKIDNVGLSGMTILCFSFCFYEYAVLAVLCHLFLSKHNKVILHMLIVYFCFWTFVTFRQRLSLIRKQKQKQRRLITEGNGLPLTLEFRHAFCLV